MRSSIIVLGGAIAILGYAVVYNAMSNLLPTSGAFPCGPVSIIDGLVPGMLKQGQGASGGSRASGAGLQPSAGGFGHTFASGGAARGGRIRPNRTKIQTVPNPLGKGGGQTA